MHCILLNALVGNCGTYTRFQCRSYGGSNFYVAGENAQFAPQGDQIQKPGQPLSNGTSSDPNVSYYGWWYCDSLPDSARISICEKDFVYCADQSSGMLKYDTVLIVDTLRSFVHKFDTVITLVYDTNVVNVIDTVWHTVNDTITHNVHDTTVIDVIDTLRYIFNDTVVNKIVRNDTVVLLDTNRIVIYDTTYKELTKVDTLFNYDTLYLTIMDTIVKKVLLYDTTTVSFEKTFSITVDLPKIRKHRTEHFV